MRHLLSWRHATTDASVSGTFSSRSFSTPQTVWETQTRSAPQSHCRRAPQRALMTLFADDQVWTSFEPGQPAPHALLLTLLVHG